MTAADNSARPPAFFTRADWWSCAATGAMAFVVYWFTLAPDVTLEFSGELSVAAMHGGVPHPPGYPVWVMLSWLWLKLFPFGNIAWRLAVESALTGALAGGVIALMVSRGGRALLENTRGLQRLAPGEEKTLCAVCGVIAGLGFCFEHGVWKLSIIVEVWPLNELLWALTLCALMRWAFAPERRRWLLAAMFTYGLTLTDCQPLLGAAFGLQLFIALQKPALGRDIFLLTAIFCAASAASALFEIPFPLNSYLGYASPLRMIFVGIGVAAAVLCTALTIGTRRLFTEWKTILLLTVFFGAGLLFYFYVPLASMSNPPMNWGYPRTTDGFLHAVTRGQFDQPHLTLEFARLAAGVRLALGLAVRDPGWFYCLAAVVPLAFIHRMNPMCRHWFIGLWTLAVVTLLLLVWMLNPSPDRANIGLISFFFLPVHLLLVVLAGGGMVLAVTTLTAARKNKTSTPPT